jgi:hypothetical protein
MKKRYHKYYRDERFDGDLGGYIIIAILAIIVGLILTS